MGTVEPGAPLFTVTWNGESAPGQFPTAAPPRAEETPAFTLVPSVTRAGAEIRFASPLARPAKLVVHDVSGRRVASQDIAAGAASTHWDGSGATGSTPAGVYFVSVVEGDRRATARLTRVR
jgi:hypothetical protein